MPNLSLAWDGITVEYLQSDPHTPDVNPGFVVSLAISHQPIDSPMLTSHLHLTVNPTAINPEIAEQIQSVTLPFNYSQTVIDPSILHLIRLLRTEMQMPQPLSQILISAIANILITHLVEHQIKSY
jgi:hypothetical protein